MKVTSTKPYAIGALSSAIVFAPHVVASGTAMHWEPMLPSRSGSVESNKTGLFKNQAALPRQARPVQVLPFDWSELDDIDDRLPPTTPVQTMGTVLVTPGEVRTMPVLPFDWSELDDLDEE